MEGAPDGPEHGELILDIMLETQYGTELYTFRQTDTIVRSFDAPYAYMNYIYQTTDDPARPHIICGYAGLERYLVSEGFVEIHAAVPEDIEKTFYAEYGIMQMEHELKRPDGQVGDDDKPV